MNIFDEIRQKNYDPKKSWDWFNNNVRQIKSAKELSRAPMKMLTDNQPKLMTQLKPDAAYMFFYDPKMKEELPYYDNFPLVIPFNKDADSFIGINFHYLPIMLRFQLFRKIMTVVNMPNRDENTKMKLTWRLISNAAKFPEVQPCVKRYLIGHVKSRFLRISPADLEIAIALPLERFKKAENNYIWKKSREMIGR